MRKLLGRFQSAKAQSSTSSANYDVKVESARPAESVRSPHGLPLYQFVEIAERDIRLVHILPAQALSEPVRCFITHHKREEAPLYVAISYTWGNELSRTFIECNESQLEITENCEAALRAVRLKQDVATVWVDGICIDQTNATEKNVQVANMGDVYRLATQTFLCLGDSDRELDILDDTIDDSEWRKLLTRDYFTRIWIIQEIIYSKNIVVVVGTQHIAWLDLVALCEARKLEVPLVMQLRVEFGHEYGMRPPKFWDDTALHIDRRHDDDNGFAGLSDIDDGDDVLAALSNTTTRTAGSSSRSATNDQHIAKNDVWEQKLAVALAQRDEENVASDQVLGSSLSETTTGTGRVNLNYWRLPQMLNRTCHFRCRDPKDKLFAILPLFVQPIPRKLFPDYRKSVMEVFRDLTTFLVEQDDPSCFENVIGPSWRNHRKVSSDVPSWVYDWTNRRKTSQAFDTFTLSPASMRTGRAGFPPGTRSGNLSRIDVNSWRIRGQIAGRVKAWRYSHSGLVDLLTGSATRSINFTIQTNPCYRDTKTFEVSLTFFEVVEHECAFLQKLVHMVSPYMDHVMLKPSIVSSVTLSGDMIATESSLISLQRDLERCTERVYYSRTTYMADVQMPTGFPADNYQLEDGSGNACLASFAPQVGDLICILFGFTAPFVLRRRGDKAFSMLGECYHEYVSADGFNKLNPDVPWHAVWSEPCPLRFKDFIIR